MLNQPLAGNVDEPEGSLDALMQAMVCRQRVGWRQNARKIILMATDRQGDQNNIFKYVHCRDNEADPLRCHPGPSLRRVAHVHFDTESAISLDTYVRWEIVFVIFGGGRKLHWAAQ